jgi:hypothetical protein
MPALIRLTCLLCATAGLTACAPMLSLLGTNQTFVQVVAQVERVKLAADGASYAASSKTLTDHALSMMIGLDCKVFNVVAGKPVCAAKPGSTETETHTETIENVQLSANELLPLSAAQTVVETDTENSSPPRDQAAGDE